MNNLSQKLARSQSIDIATAFQTITGNSVQKGKWKAALDCGTVLFDPGANCCISNHKEDFINFEEAQGAQ